MSHPIKQKFPKNLPPWNQLIIHTAFPFRKLNSWIIQLCTNFECKSKSGDKIWITPIKVIFLKKCHLLKQDKERASNRTPSPFQSTKLINQWTICIFHHRVRLRWFLVLFTMRWGFYPRRSQCSYSCWLRLEDCRTSTCWGFHHHHRSFHP